MHLVGFCCWPSREVRYHGSRADERERAGSTGLTASTRVVLEARGEEERRGLDSLRLVLASIDVANNLGFVHDLRPILPDLCRQPSWKHAFVDSHQPFAGPSSNARPAPSPTLAASIRSWPSVSHDPHRPNKVACGPSKPPHQPLAVTIISGRGSHQLAQTSCSNIQVC